MTEIVWFPVEENPEADFQVVCLLSRKVKFSLSSFANVPSYLEDQENECNDTQRTQDNMALWAMG